MPQDSNKSSKKSDLVEYVKSVSEKILPEKFTCPRRDYDSIFTRHDEPRN